MCDSGGARLSRQGRNAPRQGMVRDRGCAFPPGGRSAVNLKSFCEWLLGLFMFGGQQRGPKSERPTSGGVHGNKPLPHQY